MGRKKDFSAEEKLKVMSWAKEGATAHKRRTTGVQYGCHKAAGTETEGSAAHVIAAARKEAAWAWTQGGHLHEVTVEGLHQQAPVQDCMGAEKRGGLMGGHQYSSLTLEKIAFFILEPEKKINFFPRRYLHGG